MGEGRWDGVTGLSRGEAPAEGGRGRSTRRQAKEILPGGLPGVQGFEIGGSTGAQAPEPPEFEPGAGPSWRRFDDGSDDGFQNLHADLGLPAPAGEGVMSWLVTYVEYHGAEAVSVDLCLGSDDGAQVWFDDRLVYSSGVCRSWAACQDRISLGVSGGLHRIAVGVWERSGDWGFSLALEQDGAPIPDDSPDWSFHGIEGDGYSELRRVQRVSVTHRFRGATP